MAKHLTYEDRKIIERMCREGYSTKEIAIEVNMHRTSLQRELTFGGGGNKKRHLYNAQKAQETIGRRHLL